jgi:hypothetical protein
MIRILGPVTALALCMGFLSGCHSSDDNPTPQPQTRAEQEKQIQARIDEIKNNPNIPDDQKAMAIGQLQMKPGKR